MTRNPDLNENSGEAAIPVGTNNAGGVAPQASSVIGTPAPPPQTIESVGCSQAYTCLNPYGPVDRLNEGAIVFDLPQLCYSQYLDVDQQFEITDDMSPGSVILQIPYHPISDYTNPFIKMYAGFHSRYNGDLLFRAQLIGNATYSGTLMLFWYPTQYPSTIVTMAEAQKYEYKSMSVVMPSVEAFVLRDARQYQYYREMSDASVADRPHLVLCIHTTVVSPLREGIKVRLRIGSKLASITDAQIAGVPIQPFRLANPVLNEIHPDNKTKSLNNMTLGEVFPYYARRPLYGIIDGNTVPPSVSYLDETGRMIDFLLQTPVPCLFGGDFPQTQFKRLFTSATTYSTVSANVVRSVLVIHQLPVTIEKSIATDTTFTDIVTDATNWLSKFAAAEAIQKYVTADVIRSQTAPVSIWTDPDSPTTIFKVMSQLHMVTRHGMIVAFAMQYENAARDFDASKKIAIPNTASGKKLTLPFNPVLGAVAYIGTLITLPVPWFGFKITENPTTIVTSNDETAPTDITSPTILEYFKIVTESTSPDQAFQFDLVDPTSKVRVMTVRFLPSLQNFVINASDTIRYREYQGDITKLLIANAGNIPLATTMPISDTSAWPKRFPESMNQITSTQSSRMAFRPNAAFAAESGALAEAGSSAFAETSFGARLAQSGRSAISDTEVAGGTQAISREITTPRYMWSTGSRTVWPDNARSNIYGKRSLGTMTNNMYTFSHATQSELIGTSEGTQAGTSAATTRDKVTQVYRPESTHAVQTDNLYTNTRGTQTGGKPVGGQFNLEHGNSILSYYHAIASGGSPSDFDRFTYMSSRDSMRVNGGAVVKGEYDKAMQSNQNQWQSGQNDIQRQFQNEQNQQKYTHENEMQQHGFAHEDEMQANKFAQERTMQQNQFQQDRTMQSNEFNFKNQYQGQQFQHDTDMSNLNFEHNKYLGKQQIAGALLNTATGGAFNIANTVVSKGADAYLQQRNFHNQQSLMTQQMNQSMFVRGASAQAMKLAA